MNFNKSTLITKTVAISVDLSVLVQYGNYYSRLFLKENPRKNEDISIQLEISYCAPKRGYNLNDELN